jgi:hypothetical protein
MTAAVSSRGRRWSARLHSVTRSGVDAGYSKRRVLPKLTQFATRLEPELRS